MDGVNMASRLPDLCFVKSCGVTPHVVPKCLDVISLTLRPYMYKNYNYRRHCLFETMHEKVCANKKY